MNNKILQATSALLESYTTGGVKIHHLDRRPLPAHAEVIRVLASSLETYPPGSFMPGANALEAVQHFGSAMFSTGLRLAMPIIGIRVIRVPRP